jgi:hypothetical protein
MNFFFILILIGGILYCVPVDKYGQPFPGAEPALIKTADPAHKTDLSESPLA